MTDVPILLLDALSKTDTNDLRFEISEVIHKILMDEYEAEPETVPVTIEFSLHKDDWNRYRACNLAHISMTPREAIAEMIGDCLFSGGPLNKSTFGIV